jgi:hypothetical protein
MVDTIILICKFGGVSAVLLIGGTLLAIALGKINA